MLAYVETTEQPPRLLLGTISAQGSSGLIVFCERNERRLSFRVNEMQIMLLDARVSSVTGELVARVVDGHFETVNHRLCQAVERAGHFRITHPTTPDMIPTWALDQMRSAEEDYAADEVLTLLEMEVVAPNFVRVQGAWLDAQGGMIITRQSISFVRPDLRLPISLMGQGPKTCFEYAGPVDEALFLRAPRA